MAIQSAQSCAQRGSLDPRIAMLQSGLLQTHLQAVTACIFGQQCLVTTGSSATSWRSRKQSGPVLRGSQGQQQRATCSWRHWLAGPSSGEARKGSHFNPGGSVPTLEVLCYKSKQALPLCSAVTRVSRALRPAVRLQLSAREVQATTSPDSFSAGRRNAQGELQASARPGPDSSMPVIKLFLLSRMGESALRDGAVEAAIQALYPLSSEPWYRCVTCAPAGSIWLAEASGRADPKKDSACISPLCHLNNLFAVIIATQRRTVQDVLVLISAWRGAGSGASARRVRMKICSACQAERCRLWHLWKRKGVSR